jgi:hypothetical protein
LNRLIAALDKIHNAVKNTLIKDGWIITDGPYQIAYGERKVHVDLSAEKFFLAEKGGAKIAVEVKSFLSPSRMRDFELSLGQYNLYQTYLELTAPERKLYLAVDDKVYEDFFTEQAVRVALDKFQISIIVVNLENEEIVRWIR